MISILFLSILVLFFILIKKFKLSFNKLIICIFSLFIIIFFININSAIEGVTSASLLCANAIIPTVFPFSVICNLIISYNGINYYSKVLEKPIYKILGLSKASAFPIIASFLCGYPLGAKYSSEIYEKGYISKEEYSRLINIATNCGPLFIVGSVSSAMLNNTNIGYYLLIANYLSVIIIAIITKKNTSSNCIIKKNLENTTTSSFGENFKNAIDNAIKTTLCVIGFILIFAVLINILKNSMLFISDINNIESILNVPHNLLSALLLGLIEITTGIKLICTVSAPFALKLALISFLCSFSGLSIISQSLAFISKNNICISKFIFLKFFQGIISFIITYLLFSILDYSTFTLSFFNNDAFSININYISIIINILFLICFIFCIKRR